MFNPGKQRDVHSDFWNEVISEFDQSGDGKVLSLFLSLFTNIFCKSSLSKNSKI